MTNLHQRLMALVAVLRLNGQLDEAAWIARHVAREQKEASRRRGNRQSRRRKVRIVTATGKTRTAWIAADRLREGREEG